MPVAPFPVCVKWSSCSSRASISAPAPKRRENTDPDPTLSKRASMSSTPGKPSTLRYTKIVSSDPLKRLVSRGGDRVFSALTLTSWMPGEKISSPGEKFSALKNASTPRASATRATATSAYNGHRRSAPLVVVLGRTLIPPHGPPHLGSEPRPQLYPHASRSASVGSASTTG